MAIYVLRKLAFFFAAQEQRRLLHVGRVVRMVDDSVCDVVVQVGAGPQGDIPSVDGFVEALKQGGIGPGLIAGVGSFAFPGTAPLGDDDAVLCGQGGGRPLLQLDHDQVRAVVLVAA